MLHDCLSHKQFLNNTSVFILVTILLVITVTSSYFNQIALADFPGGDSLYIVPIKLCPMEGTPALATTGAYAYPYGYEPDEKLFYYLSGVNIWMFSNTDVVLAPASWYPLYRIIPDDYISPGSQLGDILDRYIPEPNDLPVESAMFFWCDFIWSGNSIPDRGSLDGFESDIDDGIIFVIVKDIVDENGHSSDTIGWGGCYRQDGYGCNTSSGGLDGFALVEDHLQSIIKTGYVDGETIVLDTDPGYESAGHELGHALGLTCGFWYYEGNYPGSEWEGCHNSWPEAMMYYSQQDNNGDGKVDNFAIYGPERSALESTALTVSGMQIDPKAKFISGNFISDTVFDSITKDFGKLPGYQDIGSVKFTIDTIKEKFIISQKLAGLIQKNEENAEYWTLVNIDDNKLTGANKSHLTKIGAPQTRFPGADIIVKANVSKLKPSGSVWRVSGGTLVQLSPDIVKFELERLDLIPHFAMGANPDPKLMKVSPLSHKISVVINEEAIMPDLDKTFRVQAMSVNKSSISKKPIDLLDDTPDEGGKSSKLVQNKSTHCFPEKTDASVGEKLNINVEGLSKDSAIVAKIDGLKTVIDAKTDHFGKSSFSILIPTNVTSGAHLFTVSEKNQVKPKTSYCLINVSGQEPTLGTGEPLQPPTPNQKPKASAGRDIKITEGKTVSLDGTGSVDPDKEEMLYFLWKQTKKSSAESDVGLNGSTKSKAEFIAPQVDKDTKFIFTLNVSDGKGGKDTDAVQVTVLDKVETKNKNPIANAGPDIKIYEGANVTLSGEKSYDPEGGPLKYQWTQIKVNGRGGADVTPTIILHDWQTIKTTFIAPKVTDDTSLKFMLTVIDKKGAKDTDTAQVIVLNKQQSTSKHLQID